jgi:hypothetical protein
MHGDIFAKLQRLRGTRAQLGQPGVGGHLGGASPRAMWTAQGEADSAPSSTPHTRRQPVLDHLRCRQHLFPGPKGTWVITQEACAHDRSVAFWQGRAYRDLSETVPVRGLIVEP